MYACALTDRSEVLVDFLCSKLADDYIENGYNNQRDDIKFLSLIRMAIVEKATVDPFHNKHINFVTEQSSQVYTYVHVPCRYYVFDDLVDDDLGDDYEEMWMRGFSERSIRYIQGEDIPRGQCALNVGGDILSNCLKVIRKLSKYQHWLSITWVHITNLLDVTRYRKEDCFNEYSELAELLFENYRLGENVKSVTIRHCRFSHDMYRHITRELLGRDQLETLVFIGNNSKLPLKLSKTLVTLTSLKKLDLSYCEILFICVRS